MRLLVIISALIPLVYAIDVQARSSSRDGRKLFGGYRITPRYCKPTRDPKDSAIGANICMFNHECAQRNGVVVGACMDGFLFGACCQLPKEDAGDLQDSEIQATLPDNVLYTKAPSVLYTKAPSLDGVITSSALNQITSTLLQDTVIPTAQEDAVVQINEQDQFSKTGVTQVIPENLLVNQNPINPEEFKPAEDRKTTVVIEETTRPYDTSPVLQISISGPPFRKPIFRPKPPSDADKYILVPTISKPNKTEIDSIVNIINMLNGTTYANNKLKTTTKYPGGSTTSGSTKYPSSTTTKYTTVTRKPTTTKGTTKSTRKPSKKPTSYISSSTFRPTTTLTTSKKPPSTSYVFSTTISKRPTTTTANYAVTKPNPPTLIVLGALPNRYTTSSTLLPNYSTTPSKYTSTKKPPTTYTATTSRPVTLTINNHITQNIYSTERPSPTVLITPKPSASTYSTYRPTTLYEEVETSADDLINFPPVRNPNLNISVFDGDITTPDFIEDDVLNKKVESFVNKIIEGLQEPFQGLRDVVYNKNKTAFLETTTKKPVKKQGTTKRPTRRPSGGGSRPTTKKTTTLGSSSKKPTSKRTKPTKATKVTTTTENFIEVVESTESIYSQDYRAQCGVRPLMKSARIVGGKGASFGEFPWQVLVRESTWLGLFTKNKCGGVLISHQYVMTAAHCQPGFLASLVAVFGEFDISGDLETKRAISRNVKRVIVHRQYDAATFENDLALLELEHPVQFDAHIVPICLPRDHEDFTGRMATVTGWGRLKYGGGVPSVLQEVQVPIMENVVCQEMFRTAGHSKVILESFLCAGYANGQKDSCEGDSGGPLVLQRPDGRYQLAGTVSHGIKCAAPYLPGVYMRTTFYKPWIESITGVH